MNFCSFHKRPVSWQEDCKPCTKLYYKTITFDGKTMSMPACNFSQLMCATETNAGEY